MKKCKTLLLLAMCLAMVVTTITVPENGSTITPTGHYEYNGNRK